MALFKIFKGQSSGLPKTYKDGYCYFTTDDGKMYIDTKDSDSTGRICLNAAKADSATKDNKGNIISSTYLPLSGGTMTGNVTMNNNTKTTYNLTIKNDYTVNSPTEQPITINAGLASGIELTDRNAPGIGFHVGNTTWGNLILTKSGFKFINNTRDGLMSIYAARLYGNVTGNLTGNADTASKLATTRNIALTGDVTGNVNFDGSGNVSITTTNKHGLLHSNFTTFIPENTTSGGWELIDSSYNKSGFFLKSIRTSNVAPTWILGNYASGIAFGGHDTKGVMSVAYNSPQVKFAGGNGMTPVWNFQINATSGQTYTFPSVGGIVALTTSNITGNAATATKLQTARTIRTNLASTSTASFDGSADITPGVTGVLPTTNGGTGVNSHTTNRLVWSMSATQIQGGYHYASTSKIGVNLTSEPSTNFYVNGSAAFSGSVIANSDLSVGGSLTVNTNKSNGLVSLLEDAEGGTIVLRSKNGTYQYHIDAYNDETIRIHTADLNPNGSYKQISWNGKTGELIATSFNGSLAWSNITGKPSTYAPSSHSHSSLTSLGNLTPESGRTSARGGLYTYNAYNETSNGAPQSYLSVIGFGKGVGGHVEIAGHWCDNKNLWFRSLRDCDNDWSAWNRIWVSGNTVTGAVWNDYAECRESHDTEPGYVLMEVGNDSLTKTIERLSHFAGISSDTYGFSQGETDKAKTPIAVAGRVLVYPYQDRNNYKPGDCVCAAPGGTVDIMTREEIINWPDRIVGTVSCVPDYEEWGSGEMADRPAVKVNGRIWIKVK